MKNTFLILLISLSITARAGETQELLEDECLELPIGEISAHCLDKKFCSTGVTNRIIKYSENESINVSNPQVDAVKQPQ